MYKIGDKIKIMREDGVFGWLPILKIGGTFFITALRPECTPPAIKIRVNSDGFAGFYIPEHCVCRSLTDNQLMLFEL